MHAKFPRCSINQTPTSPVPDNHYGLPSNNDFVYSSSEDPPSAPEYEPEPIQTYSQNGQDPLYVTPSPRYS